MKTAFEICMCYQVTLSLDFVLHNEKYFEAFQVFLSQEFSVENLLFWSEIERFKSGAIIPPLMDLISIDAFGRNRVLLALRCRCASNDYGTGCGALCVLI